MKLSVDGLNSHYGPAHILFDVALEVGEGEVVALLGFDTVGGPRRSACLGEFSLLRMALDTINNAIEHEFLEHQRAALQQARRLEAIGTLASGIAHNFNNIIAAILGYVEMAEAQVARGSRHERHLAEIRRAGERGRDVVEHLLRFGRRRGGHHRPLNVRDLMTETESLLRASLPVATPARAPTAPSVPQQQGQADRDAYARSLKPGQN